MDSNTFFNDTEFNGKWKGKSGIYIIEQELFSKHLGFPVYKVGFATASNGLYSRVSNYRTMYGLIPFKIHCLYAIPMGVFGEAQRTNYANLMEKKIHKTAIKYGEWAGVGEWFKNLSLLMSIVNTVREQHLAKFQNASKWEFYHKQYSLRSLKQIELVGDDDIDGSFKDVKYGERTTRSRQFDKSRAEQATIKLDGGKRLFIPKTYIDETGKERKLGKSKKPVEISAKDKETVRKMFEKKI